MEKQTRLKPDVRREVIVRAALALAQNKNYKNVTREEIAGALNITGAAIQYHFKTMENLHRSVMRAACQLAVAGDEEALRVVGQGIFAKNDMAMRVSDNVKQAIKDLEW